MSNLSKVEATILFTITLIGLIGLGLVYVGSVLGSATLAMLGSTSMIAAIVAYVVGWKRLTVSPLQTGAVTINGKFLKTTHNGVEETVPLRGIVILAPYWPFFIDVVVYDMTAQEWVFDVTIMSVEDTDDHIKDGIKRSVPVKGKVFITAIPDKRHLNSFTQSGGELAKVKELMRGIVFREVQKIVRGSRQGKDDVPGLSFIEMTQQGDVISDDLEKRLNGIEGCAGVFEQKSFGVFCTKVQVEFTIPPDIDKEMLAAASIGYTVSARNQEYAGDVIAAGMFLELAGGNGAKAAEMARLARLTRDGAVERVQIEHIGTNGSSANINISEVSVGGKRNRGKGP